MVKCEKCKQFVSRGEIVQCKGICGSKYHKNCASQGKLLSIEGLCLRCAKDEGTPVSQGSGLNVDLEKTSPSALLGEVNKKLEILFSVKKTLDDLVEAVDFYAHKYEELVKAQQKTDQKMVALEQKNVYLEKYSAALEERISVLESKGRERNIEIVGLQSKDGEDIKAVVENMARKMNLNPINICDVMRVGVEKVDKENKKRPRSVIVTLSSSTVRSEWLAKKRERMYNKDVYSDGNNTPIYFNEDLTKHIRQLLWYTKTELREIYKYIWVQNGKILARKDDSEKNKKIYVIRKEEDVNSMKNRE